MIWKYATDPALVKYFEHESVWTKTWEHTQGDDIVVTDPSHGNELLLSIYEAEFGGVKKRFAAGEVSNGVFIFYLPAA